MSELINHKAQQLIQSFSEKELKEFGSYLYSVSPNASLHRLFGALGKKVVMSKNNLYSVCYPNQKYNDKKLRYLFTDLTKVIEKWLVQNRVVENTGLFESELLKELSERSILKAYNGVVNSIREKETIATVRDCDFFLNRYQNEHTHLQHLVNQQTRSEKTNIETVLDSLDKFFLLKKLQLCCEIYNVRNVSGLEYKAFLLDEIMAHLSKNKYTDVPGIIIYYTILQSLQFPDNTEYLQQLITLLEKHEVNFSKRELRDMYQYALNFCIKKINLGETTYQHKLFELYKKIVANKALMAQGWISQWDFKNIVTISIRLKEFSWALKFINEHKKYLKPEERENAYAYNLAYFHFNKGLYSKALQQLQKVEFTDPFYQLDSKAILLKTYYEQDDLETLFYHISSYKIFVKRNKQISDYQRLIYSNLIKYTQALAKYKHNTEKIKLLKTEIEQSRQIADYNWLLLKYEEEIV